MVLVLFMRNFAWCEFQTGKIAVRAARNSQHPLPCIVLVLNNDIEVHMPPFTSKYQPKLSPNVDSSTNLLTIANDDHEGSSNDLSTFSTQQKADVLDLLIHLASADEHDDLFMSIHPSFVKTRQQRALHNDISSFLLLGIVSHKLY